MKQSTGKLVGVEVRREGSTNNKPWTIYSYRIQHEEGQRYYTGFDRPDTHLLGEDVVVDFEESPNPKNDKFPYRNLKKMVKAPEEGSIAKPITPESEFAPKLSGVNLLGSDTGVVPSADEAKVMDLIKVRVGVSSVSEADFVETLADNCGTARERGVMLFKVFKGGV